MCQVKEIKARSVSKKKARLSLKGMPPLCMNLQNTTHTAFASERMVFPQQDMLFHFFSHTVYLPSLHNYICCDWIQSPESNLLLAIQLLSQKEETSSWDSSPEVIVETFMWVSGSEPLQRGMLSGWPTETTLSQVLHIQSSKYPRMEIYFPLTSLEHQNGHQIAQGNQPALPLQFSSTIKTLS